MANNVLGTELQSCSTDPITGFYRNGCCDTGGEDQGVHTVCAVMTADFLEFSAAAGNDLSTPRPEFRFPGLVPGDRWCLCASRWVEANEAGKAPRVVLAATHARTLEWASLAELSELAVDAPEVPEGGLATGAAGLTDGPETPGPISDPDGDGAPGAAGGPDA